MFITGLGTASPQHRFTQKECWDIFSESELSRQLVETKHEARKKQLTSALAELDKQLAAFGAVRTSH